jgi:serine/threonine-protein kinase
MVAELAAGRRVMLIGETGGPRWSRWVRGGGQATTEVDADGTFTLYSADLGLLELLPDPGTTRYRIQAEVWHRKSYPEAEVGVYVCRSDRLTPLGRSWSFIQLAFDDKTDTRILGAELQKQVPNLVIPPGNRVALTPGCFCVDNSGNSRRFRYPDQGNGALFLPNTGQEVKWRTIAIEVTPERLQGFWDGSTKPISPKGLVLPRRPDPRDGTAEGWVLDDQAVGDGLLPWAALRGGVGLYALQSHASFRSVVITPLPSPEQGQVYLEE